MVTAVVSAAFSVLGKALAPLTNPLLKNWAASKDLGSNVDALELELLTVQALLEDTRGKEIADNAALKKLMVMLQELAYDADDELDELDYFRIQDVLDDTCKAADKHAKGSVHNLALNAKAVGKQMICLPACLSAATHHPGAKDNRLRRREVTSGGCMAKLASRAFCNTSHAAGKCFPCTSQPSVRGDDDESDDNSMHNSPQRNHHTNEPPKLTFDRVAASTRMQHIVDQLQQVRGNVSSIIAPLGSNWSTVPNVAQSRRPITNSEIIEPKLYGRDNVMSGIMHDITKGKHCGEVLTVIPIVGPGGIGKTTLAQHIYHSDKVRERFDVKVWTCVSLNFNANKLIEEIAKYIPKVEGESLTDTPGEAIGKRLKTKRFLLVLDDIWDCSRNEDEWKRLLVPFKKSQVQGNVIIVTTRLPEQAQLVKTIDHPTYLRGLDHKEFRELFLDFVFVNDQSRKDHEFLLETGDNIIGRLKGSPLAAKTVGTLLKTQLEVAHWTRVLESKEWEKTDGENDIMPALQLSYDYLPSQLQRCFSYCALFPQDYKFKREELINFWIGLEVLQPSHDENKMVEDIGLSHLIQLVNQGFFEQQIKDGNTFYILHDLLHELAQKVSSHECLSIDSSKVRSLLAIPLSIRHLSVNIDDLSLENRSTLKNCLEDFNTLDTRLKVEKLRSLMLFGEQHGYFVKAFSGLFREAKALRVVFLSGASYGVEDLLQNFRNLLHLRYLRIQSSSPPVIRFPNNLSRFYHMMVLDAKNCVIVDLPRDMSNLAKLRHFLVRNDATHSSIVEVGKLKSLQELRRFVVQQEGHGFELSQIGNLEELCGTLLISNLENVQVKDEADKAKLMQKRRLHGLKLHWNAGQSINDSALQEHVLERLKPSSNLLKLTIVGHRGATCPSWLGMNLSVKKMESLCLDGVGWKTFPPIGELQLVNVHREETSGNVRDKKFENLRRLELVNLPMLEKWAVHAPCQLFPFLEVLVIKGCSQLVELSFSHSACCQQEKEAYANWFPRLSELKITKCPQLLSFPPVPWTADPCSIKIKGTGHSCLIELVCEKNYDSEYCLRIEGKKDTSDSMFWNVLAFPNLTKLEELDMEGCQPPPLHHLQMLSSLRKLEMSNLSDAFIFVEGDSHVKYQFPVELLEINDWNASGKELTQLLTYFPKLSDLQLRDCKRITGLGVMAKQATTTPGALDAEGLLVPPQLQLLLIYDYPELILYPYPLDDNQQDGRTGGGGGLQGLSSLRRLHIMKCPKLLSSYLSSSFCSYFPFPKSLEYLGLGYFSLETLAPLSNLTSLTHLYIVECGDLRGGEMLSLLAQGHLTSLDVRKTPNLFVDSEPSLVHEQELTPHQSKLQQLEIDDVDGVTATPICSFIFSSLTTLTFINIKVDYFTEEQESLLFVNSLEEITFDGNLKDLPARLHRLHNLKKLEISHCRAIQMLAGLPSSLQELCIHNSHGIQSLSTNDLPSSLQKIKIMYCRAIRLVPMPKEDDLPSSLRELYVHQSESEELKRQCRKFIGIIPIVRVD